MSLNYEFVNLDKDDRGYFLAVKNIGSSTTYQIYYSNKKVATTAFDKYAEKAKKSTKKV